MCLFSVNPYQDRGLLFGGKKLKSLWSVWLPYLREGQECLSLDVSSDLVNRGGQLVNLSQVE